MKIKTIGVVSLSSGMLGEDFAKRQRELGIQRLEAYGIKVKFMTNALKGIAYLNEHPEARAADLIEAFRDPEVDLIMTAIGGDDTYRLLPYLFGHDELKNAITDKPFLGFSDTTVNHLMLHKLGLPTLYGQAFLTYVDAYEGCVSYAWALTSPFNDLVKASSASATRGHLDLLPITQQDVVYYLDRDADITDPDNATIYASYPFEMQTFVNRLRQDGFQVDPFDPNHITGNAIASYDTGAYYAYDIRIDRTRNTITLSREYFDNTI